MFIPYCIGCGCDDYHACMEKDGEPCCWLVVDYEEGRGVCSCCAEHLDRWVAGDREIAGPAALEAIEEIGPQGQQQSGN